VKYFVKILFLILFLFTFKVFAQENELNYNKLYLKKLRKDFKSAHAPSSNELNLKKTWQCYEYSAKKNFDSKQILTFFFKFKYQGEVKGEKKFKNLILPSHLGFRLLHLRKDALVGYGTLGADPILDTHYIYFIRATHDGRLIVESTKREWLESEKDKYFHAISKSIDGSDSLLVLSYSECNLKE
jgi:hypothetical protein